MVLELEVLPELGLYNESLELLLGMPLSVCVSSIQALVTQLKQVQLVYSESKPLETDVELRLTLDGIILHFDAIGQRLKCISINDLSLVTLKYRGHVFSSVDVCPSIEQIDESFGATHPGVYDSTKNIFTLSFRGISFEFPIKATHASVCSALKLGRLKFSKSESPVVARMVIFTHNSDNEPIVPPMPQPRHPLVINNDLLVLRRRRRTLGLRLSNSVYPGGMSSEKSESKMECDVYFGDSVQDVLASLGSPNRVFFKAEDKMRIHCNRTLKNNVNTKADFFYNYFNLGLDILFDGHKMCVKKFVLHTNFPGHYNFNMYHRCQFRLPLRSEHDALTSLVEKTEDNCHFDDESNAFVVTTFSKWSEIQHRVRCSDRPVVLNRSSSTNTTNPFGSTFCYGHQDVIFEVMANGHLASLTLYAKNKLAKIRRNINHGENEESKLL